MRRESAQSARGARRGGGTARGMEEFRTHSGFFFFFFLTHGDAMNRCRAAHAHPRGSPCAHAAQRSAGPGPAGGGQRGGTGGPLGLGGGWLPAAACGAAGSAFCGTLPLKMAWRPLLGGCGGSSPAPQAFRRFKMLFSKHHFYSSPSMWSLGRRRGTDSRFSPPGVPPARSRSRGMRWGSALLYVRRRERPCRTGAAALPLCPPGGDRAAVAIRVLGW